MVGEIMHAVFHSNFAACNCAPGAKVPVEFVIAWTGCWTTKLILLRGTSTAS